MLIKNLYARRNAIISKANIVGAKLRFIHTRAYVNRSTHILSHYAYYILLLLFDKQCC